MVRATRRANETKGTLRSTAPRKGWEKAFQKLHENGDDKSIMANIFDDENLELWM